MSAPLRRHLCFAFPWQPFDLVTKSSIGPQPGRPGKREHVEGLPDRDCVSWPYNNLVMVESPSSW